MEPASPLLEIRPAVHVAPPLRSATLGISVRETRPGGKPWDPGNAATVGRPDIAACIHAPGLHRCYPGGERHISGAACRDASQCTIVVDVPITGPFEVEIWDADAVVHDLISKGECRLSSTCHLSAATVEITPNP